MKASHFQSVRHSLQGAAAFCALCAVMLLPGVVMGEEGGTKDVGPPVEKEEAKPAPPKAAVTFSEEVQTLDLEKILPAPLKLKVVKDAIVYADSKGERRLGVIPKDTIVTVIFLGEKAFKVRGKAVHDKVSGWIARACVQPVDETLVISLNKTVERAQKVAALIAGNEIALGMTADEVVQSLGKPNGNRSRLDKAGATSVLEYISYKNVPQQSLQRDATGRLVQTTVWVKVESGRLSVTLENGVVTSIEDTQNALPRGPAVVPGPIIIDMLR